MNVAQTLIWLMALGTVALDVLIILAVILLICWRSLWRVKLAPAVRRYALLATFILSTLAVVGTLWMQYGDNLQPCLFCWYQRVFMYPIPVITLIAFVKNTDFSDIADYILGLSTLGFLVALYQHLLQVLPSGALIPCDATDECAVRSFFYFDFVTLPWMAVTVFCALIFIALVARKRS